MADRGDRIEKRGSVYVVLSKEGKVLGEHETQEAAERQLRAVEASKAREGAEHDDGCEWRWDAAELRMDQAESTPEGWRRVPAVIGRGDVVLPYLNADGSIRWEFRPASEVTDAASVESFSGVPVTNDHPPTHLDSQTARRFTLGSSATPSVDGAHVVSSLLLTDDSIIADVEAGKRQLSPGYRVRFDPTPGVFRGQRYDGVQREIRGNHIAVVDRGRQGPEVSLRMDSADRVFVTGDHVAREDAFVRKVGSRFVVFQGNNGRRLSSWATQAEAEEEVDRLHRKNNPSSSNRGTSARRKTEAREREMKDSDDKPKIVTVRIDGQDIETDGKTAAILETIEQSRLAKLKEYEDARADAEAKVKDLEAEVEASKGEPGIDARLDALKAASEAKIADVQKKAREDMAELERRLDVVATAKSIMPDFDPMKLDESGKKIAKTRSDVMHDVIAHAMGDDEAQRVVDRNDDGYTQAFYEQALKVVADRANHGKALLRVASGAGSRKRKDEAGEALREAEERRRNGWKTSKTA